MRKLILFIFVIAYAASCCATEFGDTTDMSLSDIIAKETLDKTDYESYNQQPEVWRHTTFLNISYNKTKFSSEEFPSSTGAFPNEFKNDLGLGLQWGHTYNLHKKPIGSVMFIGLDFTWMDLNFNKYKKDTTPEQYANEAQIKKLPWHNEKMTIGYAMSLGPSITLYPFSPELNKGAYKTRLHFYFHLGYGAEAALIKKASDSITSDEWAWANGLHTAFGASLSWNFIGVGYEFRNDGNLKYKPIDNDFGTNKMKVNEKTSRFYLQFRF